MRSFFQNLLFLLALLFVIPQATELLLFSEVDYTDFKGYVYLVSTLISLVLFLFKDYVHQKFFSKQNEGVFLLSLSCLYLLAWIFVLGLVWAVFSFISVG